MHHLDRLWQAASDGDDSVLAEYIEWKKRPGYRATDFGLVLGTHFRSRHHRTHSEFQLDRLGDPSTRAIRRLHERRSCRTCPTCAATGDQQDLRKASRKSPPTVGPGLRTNEPLPGSNYPTRRALVAVSRRRSKGTSSTVNASSAAGGSRSEHRFEKTRSSARVRVDRRAYRERQKTARKLPQ